MDIFGKTHIGKVRNLNEDTFYISDKTIGSCENLFVVADGMGGHNAGEVASKLSIDSFVEYISNHINIPIEQLLTEAIENANNVVFQQANEQPLYHGMGTTFICCTIKENFQSASTEDAMIYMANVGDSRIYVLDKQLKQVSIDHSLVEEMVRAGDITREESLTHPDRNIITRALGTFYDVKVDLFIMPKEEINKILLCSDGLTNMVSDEMIETIISKEADSQTLVEELVETALNNGGIDNITCIIIDLDHSAHKEVPTC